MFASRIVPDMTPQGKLYTIAVALFACKWSVLVAIFAGAMLAILFVFTLIMDAFMEICSHIASVYSACTPIERLLLLVIAWAFFVKVSPYIARLVHYCKGK